MNVVFTRHDENGGEDLTPDVPNVRVGLDAHDGWSKIGVSLVPRACKGVGSGYLEAPMIVAMSTQRRFLSEQVSGQP